MAIGRSIRIFKQQRMRRLLQQINVYHTDPKRLHGALEVETSTSLNNLKTINRCQVGFMTYLGHNTEIRYATIGRFCSIGSDVIIGLYNHPLTFLTTHPIGFQGNIKLADSRAMDKLKRPIHFSNTTLPVTLGHDVWIGHRAIIKSGVTIHTGAIIGAGALVTKDVPPYAIVGGNPARVINYRFDPELIAALLESTWWKYDLSYLAPEIDFDDPTLILKALSDNKSSASAIPKLDIANYLIEYENKKHALVIKPIL